MKLADKPSSAHVLTALSTTLFVPLFLLIALQRHVPPTAAVSSYPTVYPHEFGYGFNVANWDVPRLQQMGFNWIKVFNAPDERLPLNVLLRVEANGSHMSDLAGFGSSMRSLAETQKGFVDAYEIGNEPNLDASYGWTAAPNAADYAALLCTAYANIKAVDPDVIVVSAGLAPTGRVAGAPGWPPGHNGRYQDDREFLKQFLEAGGGDCLDAMGYHNYGFSADYDILPDSEGDGWGAANYCGNGFCFRGVEIIYDIMVAYDLVDKQVWTTELGWIVAPPADCLTDGSWAGRQWQIVSKEKQADNLVGAFAYARANYPWLGAMFVFNLNFSEAGYYAACEQMRYYSVQGRPAEAALLTMPKDYTLAPPQFSRLAVSPAQWAQTIAYSDQPYTAMLPLQIANTGTRPFTWTLSLAANSMLAPAWANGSGTLAAGAVVTEPVTVTMNVSNSGAYTAALVISTTETAVNSPVIVPLTLTVQAPQRRVAVAPLQWTAIITTGQVPYTDNWTLTVENVGDFTVDWDVAAVASADLTPVLGKPGGMLPPAATATVPVTVSSGSLAAGRYDAAINFTAEAGTTGAPASIPLTLYVWAERHETYLPMVIRP